MPNLTTTAPLGLTADSTRLQFTANGSWSLPDLDGAPNTGSAPISSCQYVPDVGFLHIRPIHECLLATVEQLRMIDDEVVRRNLVANQAPHE